MDAIIRSDLPVTAEVVSRDEARARIQQRQRQEPFKLEILDSIAPADAPISLYHIGSAEVGAGPMKHSWDLCAGPHLPSTGSLCAGLYRRDATTQPV